MSNLKEGYGIFKGKDLLLQTNARVYSADKTKRGYKAEDVCNNKNGYHKVYNNNQPYGFGGFIISPTKEKGILCIEFFNITNLGAKDKDLINIWSPLRSRDNRGEQYENKFYFSVDGFQLPNNTLAKRNQNILNNIYSYYGKTDKYFYCYGNAQRIQDLRAEEWDSRPVCNFCKETIQILKEAGFPDEVIYRENYTKKLENFNDLCVFFQKKQVFKTQSKQTEKDLLLFKNENIADVVKNTLVIQASGKKIVFSFAKGLKVLFLTKDGTWRPQRDKNINFSNEEQDAIILTMSKLPGLDNFADFVKEQKEKMFNWNNYCDTPFLTFLKLLKDKKMGRLIENLMRFDPSCLFHKNYCETYNFYINDDIKNYVNFDEWDLAHQLRCNKFQLKVLKENCPETNFQDKYMRVRVTLRSFYGDKEYYSRYDSHNDDSFKRPLTAIKDNDFEWLVKFLATPRLANSYYGRGYMMKDFGTTNPFRFSRKYFASDDEYKKIVHKYWDKVGKNASYSDTNEYEDYLRMREQIIGTGIVNDSLYPLLPSSMAEINNLHAELIVINDKQKMALKQAQITRYQNNTKELAEKLAYKDKDFTITLCKDPMDLKVEGAKLHHCVGSYVDTVLNEESYILFLRRNSSLDEPFLTVNLNKRKDSIIQIHGVNNYWLGNWPEAIPFVMRWLKKNKISCSDEILLSTAKGY